MQQLLSISNDAKTVKGEKYGYRTHVLYLAPGDLSGNEVCFWRSEECFKACLYLSGRGYMKTVQASRIAKTKRYFADKKQFINDLCEEIHKTSLSANKAGYIPVYRLDGTSDLFLAKHFMDLYDDAVFYDYTKVYNRFSKIVDLKNYDLTYSYSGRNKSDCLKVLASGKNVAVPFKNCLPKRLWNYQVVDGDIHDLRFLDPKGVIVGLLPKGTVNLQTSKFFIDGLSVD